MTVVLCVDGVLAEVITGAIRAAEREVAIRRVELLDKVPFLRYSVLGDGPR